MTLTVRLDDTIATALDDHCEAHGTSKSSVVQQSLADYLMRSKALGAAADKAPKHSAAFVAFEAAGLLGTGTLGTTPANKAAVRARITGRR